MWCYVLRNVDPGWIQVTLRKIGGGSDAPGADIARGGAEGSMSLLTPGVSVSGPTTRDDDDSPPFGAVPTKSGGSRTPVVGGTLNVTPGDKTLKH